MMKEAIENFTAQFAYEPEIVNRARLPKAARRYIVLGVGGSQLAAGLLQIARPEVPLIQHRDYGLPALPGGELRESLVILSSYSGNTEEALDGFHAAARAHIPRVAISVGGALLERAKESGIPYIQMPDTGIEPRMGIGFSLRSLLAVLGDDAGIEETARLSEILTPSAFESAGRTLAEKLRGFLPVIYASRRNAALAYTWKIKFNETGKIPAFCNALPEANHNEMTGFEVNTSSRELSRHFSFVLLRDAEDHPRIKRRFLVFAQLLRARGFPVEEIECEGKNAFHKIFQSVVLADWAAYYTAAHYGNEADGVPMVEEFKKRIAE